MADSGAAPKPTSSVKLVLLGEAAVGKVRGRPKTSLLISPLNNKSTAHMLLSLTIKQSSDGQELLLIRRFHHLSGSNCAAVIANSDLGKSSLVLRFVNNDFQENKEPTIGGMHLPTSLSTQRPPSIRELSHPPKAFRNTKNESRRFPQPSTTRTADKTALQPPSSLKSAASPRGPLNSRYGTPQAKSASPA